MLVVVYAFLYTCLFVYVSKTPGERLGFAAGVRHCVNCMCPAQT